MATDFAGTNTEKIEKLVAAVIEMRTTLRIGTSIIWLGFPLMLGLLAFLVTQSYSLVAKVERLNERIERLQDQMVILKTDIDKVGDRIGKLERPIK